MLPVRRLLVALFVSALSCGGQGPAPRRLTSPPGPAPAAPAAVIAVPTATPQRFADADPGFAFSDPDRRTKLATAFPAVDAAVTDELTRQSLPGVAVGIVIDGELAYAKGYGVVDPATKAAPDADTVYRIGSISKSFTALAILSLRDDGALDLDDPLTRWIPEARGLVYPTRDSRPITLRQLLTHTSGLPRDLASTAEAAGAPSEDAFVKRLDGVRIESAPGTALSYSNLGFELLGIVVAHASHSSLHDVIARRIFAPNGMASTVWDAVDVPAGRLAPSYDATPAGPRRSTRVERLGAADGAGGIYSSVRDMARYLALQLSAYPPRNDADRGIVRRATIRESHSTGIPSGAFVFARPDAKPGEPAVALSAGAYGFGWLAFRTCELDDLVGHDGGIEGYRAEVHFMTSHGVGVVVLSNFRQANPGRVIERIIEALEDTGAFTSRVAHVAASPLFAPAMTSLLAVYNSWDEAAFKQLLARPLQPGEKDELAGYRKLHGACTGFAPAEVTSPLSAHFSMTCERGSFDLAVDISPTGLVRGFAGTSRHVEPPPEVKKAAGAALSLIGRWDERAFERSFADPTTTRERNQRADASLRSSHGACKLKELSHEINWWRVEASCDRGGDIVGNMTMSGSKIASFDVRQLTQGVCPVR